LQKNICTTKTLSNEKRFSVSGLLPYFILTGLAVIILILEPNLFNYKWLGLKTDTTFVLMLVSIGQTIVLLQGGIDLSVGGVICVTNSIACLYMPDTPGGIILVTLGLLGLGLVMGFINGLIIDRTRLQPFIVTLATWSIWDGIALSILPVDGGGVAEGFKNFLIASPGGVSVSFIMMILLIIWWQYFKRTSLGISIYAVGSNEK
jgi:ribose transport system permease protein